jgi:hypothetical protein
VGGTVGRE